jgi:hypothetical protein
MVLSIFSASIISTSLVVTHSKWNISYLASSTFDTYNELQSIRCLHLVILSQNLERINILIRLCVRNMPLESLVTCLHSRDFYHLTAFLKIEYSGTSRHLPMIHVKFYISAHILSFKTEIQFLDIVISNYYQLSK